MAKAKREAVWKRKDLKRQARKTLKGNYWHFVIVCLIMAFFVGEYSTEYTFDTLNVAPQLSQTYFRTATNSQIVEALAGNINEGSPLMMLLKRSDATHGIMAGVVNSITSSGSFVFGILNAINQFVFGDKVMAGVIILVGALVTFLYWLVVANIIRVGACRFFMESKAYPGTKVNRLLYLYRIGWMKNPIKVMFLRGLYNVLWYLTIVGGFVKYYSYRMVPYILAENPDISARDAIDLSRRMMNGNKWRAFMLDVSFLGWSILSSMTLGFVGYLYSNPYKAATDAQLYLELRTTLPDAEYLLHDKYLARCPEDEMLTEYPVHLYPIPEKEGTSWLTTDYAASYSLVNIILIFFTFCMVGWVWEVFVDLFNKGVFVNRGTLYGPWLPIYGTGGVGVVLLFRKLGKRPLVLFLAVMAFCGVLEFFTSWVLEYFMGERWWDYTGYFLNIQGRVCLEGLLVFGLGGCAGIYFLAPALNNLFNKIPGKIKNAVCWGLVALFAADVAISAVHPNTAAVERPDAGASESAAAALDGGLAAPPEKTAVNR